MVGLFALAAAGRTGQGARAAAAPGAAGPAAEADRMRAALLAAVGHDLRSPLAAAAAAVSCLRSPDLQLTAADQDELLATAEESMDLVSRLAVTVLDVTRLQAGARSVFPRPADLAEIVAGSLAGLGPSGRTVRVDLPPGLPKVVADPPVMERVITNLTANALRYSPAGSPPRLTASARSGQIEPRVIDCGPGVPQGLDREARYGLVTRPGSSMELPDRALRPRSLRVHDAPITLWTPMNSSRSTSKPGAPAARRLARSLCAGTICAVPPSYIWVRYLTVGRWWPR